VQNEVYNICGGFEQSNIDTVKKILAVSNLDDGSLDKYVDFSCNRPGQDVRYALNDDKLRSLGWSPVKQFDEELTKIVDHYKDRFIW